MARTSPETLSTRLKQLSSAPVLAGVSLLVYLFTLAPGVYGYDSAELATGAYALGIVHPPGYPLYLLLGKLFTFLPFGDVAYRVNLMSAVFGSLTVLVLHLVIEKITRDRLAAWVGAGMFAFSYYFWQMAVVAEVYTLHTFLLAVAILLLLVWDYSGRNSCLIAFAGVFGLSIANHSSGLMLSPAFVFWILSSSREPWVTLRSRAFEFFSRTSRDLRIAIGRKRIFHGWFKPRPQTYGLVLPLSRPRDLEPARSALRLAGAMAGVFLAGASLYLYLPLRSAALPALDYVAQYYDVNLRSIYGVYWMASAQAYRFFAFAYPPALLPGEAAHFAGYLWRNYLGVGVMFGCVGIYWLWRNRRRELGMLAILFSINALFVINYRVVDKDTMYLPAYLAWSVFAAAGVAWLGVFVNRVLQAGKGHAVLTPLYQVALPGMLIIMASLNWAWVDMRGDNGPAEFAAVMMQKAAPNATIFAEWSPAVILEYYQVVEGQRPDLTIYNRSRASVAEFYKLWVKGMPAKGSLDQIAQDELAYVRAKVKSGPVYLTNYDPLFESEFRYRPELNFYELQLLLPQVTPSENSIR